MPPPSASYRRKATFALFRIHELQNSVKSGLYLNVSGNRESEFERLVQFKMQKSMCSGPTHVVVRAYKLFYKVAFNSETSLSKKC